MKSTFACCLVLWVDLTQREQNNSYDVTAHVTATDGESAPKTCDMMTTYDFLK